MSGDDRWDDLIKQVSAAIGDSDLSGTSRQAILEGVREAMRSLGEIGFEIMAECDQPQTPPSVEVVQGGRAKDEPVVEGTRPDLRVAEPEQHSDEHRPQPPQETAAPKPQVHTSVRLMNVDDFGDMFGQPLISEPAPLGQISLRSQSTQTIFRGETTRPYRISCASGTLIVSTNSDTVDVIGANQSLDVEASFIYVCCDDPASGIYICL